MLLLTTPTRELDKYERSWVTGILRRNLNAGDVMSSAAPLDSVLRLFSFAVSDKSLAPVLSVSYQLCVCWAEIGNTEASQTGVGRVCT